MDYKNKHKEEIIRATQLWECGDITRENLEYIFPELKESEDERIRKEFCKDIWTYIPNEKAHKYIAWLEKQKPIEHFELKEGHWYVCHRAFCCRADHLTIKEGEKFMCEKDGVAKGFIIKDPEKYFKETVPPAPYEDEQGEQKPVDKVEPKKFKVGDWIIFSENHNSIYQIERIDNYRYYLRHYLGGTLSLHFDNELIRLWTIKDAKDGDVLVTNSNIIFIFKFLDEGGTIAFRTSCTKNNGVYFPRLKERLCDQDVYPATKEQRDLLFQKMKDAGYEWDAEKKELKKIEKQGEQKPVDKIEPKFKVGDWTLGKVDGYQSDDGILEHKCAITAVKKLYEQKPAWSEEDDDDAWLNDIISKVESGCTLNGSEIKWLKSLKQKNL